MRVLDKGYVKLIDFLGDDQRVAEIARISHNSKGDKQKNEILIRSLMKMKHESPFEHIVFTFKVKAPLFVARQWFRHRIGSFMERSGRYTKFEQDYYMPDVDKMTEQMKFEVERTFVFYEELLNNGVPREVARMVLPLNTYTEWYWTVNARSLMNFLNLRADSHAQYEIRQYAKVIANIFEECCPITFDAFIEYAYRGDLLKGAEK